jgi:hypothetical protein
VSTPKVDAARTAATPPPAPRLPVARVRLPQGRRAPVFEVFNEMYRMALRAIPADKRPRRA